MEEAQYSDRHVNMIPKRAQSSHQKIANDKMKVNKMTKSAHLLGDSQRRDAVEMVRIFAILYKSGFTLYILIGERFNASH